MNRLHHPPLTSPDAQCSISYSTMSESWRIIKYQTSNQGNSECDGKETFTAGWYRFIFPGQDNGDYARIPTKPPAKLYQNSGQACGTNRPAWMSESLPIVGEPPKEVVMRFAFRGVDDIVDYRVSGAKVVACVDHNDKTYFLYYLKPTFSCNIAYCATTKS